jgi:hypothetical protein
MAAIQQRYVEKSDRHAKDNDTKCSFERQTRYELAFSLAVQKWRGRCHEEMLSVREVNSASFDHAFRLFASKNHNYPIVPTSPKLALSVRLAQTGSRHEPTDFPLAEQRANRLPSAPGQ